MRIVNDVRISNMVSVKCVNVIYRERKVKQKESMRKLILKDEKKYV